MSGNPLSGTQVQSSRQKTRLKWTTQMNSDLLECKQKAKELVASENPPRNASGRKKGYMSVMSELWSDRGYLGLRLSNQNLRDQAARLEKTFGNVQETILNNAASEMNGSSELREGEILLFEEQASNNESERNSADLHRHSEPSDLHRHSEPSAPKSPEVALTSLNPSTREIVEGATSIFASIFPIRGDFDNRNIDTRIKQKPKQTDINDINTAIDELMRREAEHSIDPTTNPFGYLWLANCILYSVVVAFLINKRWKKESGTKEQRERKTPSQKLKEAFIAQATDLRKIISVATAELDRIKNNKKLKKKGKKNRMILEKECGKVSAASLVAYIERKKSQLRKAKRVFIRKQKQEETRSLNNKFFADPGSVYEHFNKIIKNDPDNNKPSFTTSTSARSESQQGAFENVSEACSYWKELWKQPSTKTNSNPKWLEGVRSAMDELVPVPPEESFPLDSKKCAEVIKKKRNRSAPGPDRITNFWWKRAESLYKGIAASFQAAAVGVEEYPEWFTGGKTSLLPKPGEFSSQNQRPITCLNTQYKWFTSCLLNPMDKHLNDHDLLEGEQRGAKSKCSGTTDNLLIDRMVCSDSRNSKKNVNMAWIDVKKAFDSVSHEWLKEIMLLHKFPSWLCRTVTRLCKSWNTRVTVRTKQGMETSDIIHFNKGLPQGDALCPRLFTLCLNPVSWKLKATEGYKLSKPINGKITHLLYIDDMKIFAASSCKLDRVLKTAKVAMSDIGLEFNEKKCAVAHVKRGVLDSSSNATCMGESQIIENLKDGDNYKFLGVLENSKQEENLVFWGASKVYLQRLSVIWTSPLSDYHKVVASNQYALPVLTYPMWTQNCPISELQQIDRESRKILKENGGYHPLGTTDLLYLPRKHGGRGLKSIESTYKLIKAKTAIKLYSSDDPTMSMVREFEEKCERTGRRSLKKDAEKFVAERGLRLELSYPSPTGYTDTGEEIPRDKIANELKRKEENSRAEEVRRQRWQGKLVEERWEDKEVLECFSWLRNWRSAPTHTVAGVYELYQQLLPTRMYHQHKTKTSNNTDVKCRMCGKAAESVSHVISGCGALAQTKYVARHNSALKVLFFEMLRDRGLIDFVPPWHSPITPKPEYKNDRACAYWDVPVYAESTEVKANRIDVRVVDKEEKEVSLIEMSCPWIANRSQKEEEKTAKYAPLRWEMRHQFPDYKITQYNVIIDVLGGFSRDTADSVRQLVGHNADKVLLSMQKAVLSSTLNIARSFKVVTS